MMEEIVKELRQIMPFKKSTVEGDLVLIVMENPKSVVYAIVSGITRDLTKREEWWHVTMHILSVPPQQVTWTLREPQFTGQEVFTMGNEGRFIQAVKLTGPVPIDHADDGGNSGQKKDKPTRSKKAILRVVK